MRKKPIYRQRKTKRLILRPWKLGDYQKLVDANAKTGPKRDKFDVVPRLQRELTREVFKSTVLNQRSEAKKDQRYVYNIFLEKTGEYVGFMDVKTISRIPHQWADIGYFIINTYRGNGYASEALKELVKLCFEDLKYHRVEAVIDTDNEASIALARAVGLEDEGVRKHFWYQNDRWEDQAIFATTPELFGK